MEEAASACDPLAGSPSDPASLDPGAGSTLTLVNAYFLQEEAARDLRAGLRTSVEVDEVFRKARAMNVGIVRTLAFNDDPAKTGDSAIQIAPFVFDEVSLQGLDRVLARANAFGIRLVLPLGNYWDGYGGTRQYVAWAGLPNPVEGDPRFFTDPQVRAHYRAWIAHLLDRINTVDGIRYGDHPAVFAWELLNEPRGYGLDRAGTQLRAWVDEMGATVKSLSPSKLVSVGEEGFDSALTPDEAVRWPRRAPQLSVSGGSFELDTASPYVDLASIHFYPEVWGFPRDQVPQDGALWIQQHAEVARRLGKPLLLGEFALFSEGGYGLEDRRDMYRGWLRCAAQMGARAAGPWTFTNDARSPDWDAFTFKFIDGTEPWDLRNQYVDILEQAAALR